MAQPVGGDDPHWLNKAVFTGRAVSHAIFYLVMGACFIFCLGGCLALAIDASHDRPIVWGTFTRQDCEQQSGGPCRVIGRWVSDDGRIVKDGVYLEGAPDGDGTVRAAYQAEGLLGDNFTNVVHVQMTPNVAPWILLPTCVLSAGFTVYWARRWKREKAQRDELKSTIGTID